jgi:hypothetical protein
VLRDKIGRQAAPLRMFLRHLQAAQGLRPYTPMRRLVGIALLHFFSRLGKHHISLDTLPVVA